MGTETSARHRINTERDAASVTSRLQIVTSPEQEQIPHWSQRHSVWAQQPVCSVNNAAEQEQREERARSSNGQMCGGLGATPATAEDETPDGFG